MGRVLKEVRFWVQGYSIVDRSKSVYPVGFALLNREELLHTVRLVLLTVMEYPPLGIFRS